MRVARLSGPSVLGAQTAAHKASLIVAEPALRSLVYPPVGGTISRAGSQSGPVPSPAQASVGAAAAAQGGPHGPAGAPTPVLGVERPQQAGGAAGAAPQDGAGEEPRAAAASPVAAAAAAAAQHAAAVSGRRLSDAAKQLAAVTSGHVTGAKCVRAFCLRFIIHPLLFRTNVSGIWQLRWMDVPRRSFTPSFLSP